MCVRVAQQPPPWLQQGSPAEDDRYRPLPLPEDHAAPLQERLHVRHAGQEDGAELEVSTTLRGCLASRQVGLLAASSRGEKTRARLSEPDDANIVPCESTRKGGRRREGGGRQCRCVALQTNGSVLQCRSCTWVNSWLLSPLYCPLRATWCVSHWLVRGRGAVIQNRPRQAQRVRVRAHCGFATTRGTARSGLMQGRRIRAGAWKHANCFIA